MSILGPAFFILAGVLLVCAWRLNEQAQDLLDDAQASLDKARGIRADALRLLGDKGGAA